MHYIEFRFFEILHFCHNMKDLSNNNLKLIYESFNMKQIKQKLVLISYKMYFTSDLFFILFSRNLSNKKTIDTKCNNL